MKTLEDIYVKKIIARNEVLVYNVSARDIWFNSLLVEKIQEEMGIQLLFSITFHA